MSPIRLVRTQKALTGDVYYTLEHKPGATWLYVTGTLTTSKDDAQKLYDSALKFGVEDKCEVIAGGE